MEKREPGRLRQSSITRGWQETGEGGSFLSPPARTCPLPPQPFSTCPRPTHSNDRGRKGGKLRVSKMFHLRLKLVERLQVHSIKAVVRRVGLTVI